MIYVFLADGFEEAEALIPVDVLRRAGLEVSTVSIEEEFVTGAHGIVVKADTVIDKIDGTDFDMLVLPGGMPGADNLQGDKRLEEMLKFAFYNDKYIGAICAAPKILGALGFLKDKRATCFPGFEDQLTGARFTDEKTVIDGNIVTSRAIGSAMDFALTLVGLLLGNEKAKQLKGKMLV